MQQTRSSPAVRRLGVYGLILLALAMISAVIFVVVTEEAALSEDEAFPQVVVIDPERRPQFDFPESARTYDLSLNQFVDRFARVYMEGRYSDFRLMLSRRRPPILPPRFESNFNALKNVRILGIERVAGRAGDAAPVYIMRSEYELKDFAVRQGQKTRQVHVAIMREDGEWRIGPIPREAMAKLSAREKAAGTAGDESPGTPASAAQGPTTSGAGTPPRASANRPARINP